MRRATLSLFFFIFLVLAALAAKSVLLSLAPAQVDRGEFNANRAKARLAFILGDQSPHPVDSGADDAVRARLVTILQQMGLRPLVRDQVACNYFEKRQYLACARVRNVIAALGPARGKALLLSAHYDSVPVGPGASDDGIGVATLLEVGSMLKARPLRRPVLLLFNEGEELGLLGARAFLADPLSGDVDSLLNFEARGVTGPATMFETNQPNGAAIAVYASAVRHKYASSLSTDVARLIPNDTDVSTFKERGWLTLNSAIVGNETRYHSAGDDLAGLDVKSLKDMGDEALALTNKLSRGRPSATGELIFFDVARHGFVDLPIAIGLLWLLVLLVAFAFLGTRSGGLVPATSLALLTLLASSALAWLSLTAMGTLRAGTYWRAHAELTFTALYATVLMGGLALYSVVGRSMETKSLRYGYWFMFLLIGAAFAWAAPGAVIYFLFPPSLLLLGIAVSRRYPPAAAAGAFLSIFFLYLSWGELLASLEQLFSPGPLWVAAPAAALLILPAIIETGDLLRRAHRPTLIGGSAAIALLGWALVTSAPAYSQDHQQRFTIEHVTEYPSRHSFWSILNDGTPLPAAYAKLGPWHPGKLEFSARQRWLAGAPANAEGGAATIHAAELANGPKGRRIKLRIAANGSERILLLLPENAHARLAGFVGAERAIEDKPSSKLTIACSGRSCDGAELVMTVASDNPFDVTVVGSRNGLPSTAAPLINERPRFARPQYVPDETVTIVHVTV